MKQICTAADCKNSNNNQIEQDEKCLIYIPALTDTNWMQT